MSARNLISLFCIFGFSFFLGACKSVEIQDGKIPEKYLATAKKFEGMFKGEFGGRKGILTIAFAGNVPRVTFRSDDGSADLLGNECLSQIGLLKEVDLEGGNNDQLTGAHFAFSPGKCVASGNRLSLYFDNNNNFKAQVEATVRRYHSCLMVGENNFVAENVFMTEEDMIAEGLLADEDYATDNESFVDELTSEYRGRGRDGGGRHGGDHRGGGHVNSPRHRRPIHRDPIRDRPRCRTKYERTYYKGHFGR